MKKFLLAITPLALFAVMQSCGQKEMAPEEVEAKVNEMAAPKIEAAVSVANAACETRMTTDLKHVTDSLVNAAQMAQAAQ